MSKESASKQRYEFDPEQAYRLIAVTDKTGRDKSHTDYFYEAIVNCVAVNFHYDDVPSHEEYYRLRMQFVRNELGQPVHRSLHTSIVWNVKETGNGVKLITSNSIYVFEEAEVKEIPKLDEANVIELYMSLEDDYFFGAGFYYDEDKNAYELKEHVHLGMFQDSVLIHIVKDNAIRDCACRYFPMGNYVEFYDTLYGQQDYSTPMLIHNAGKMDLQIRFQMYEHVWTIKLGESKRIIPFNPDGADPEEEEGYEL